MDIMTPITGIIQTIVSLSTMVGLYGQFHRHKIKLEQFQRETILCAKEKSILEAEKSILHPTMIQNLTEYFLFIPQPTITAARKRLDEAQSKYISVIENPNTGAVELESESGKAQEAICEILELIGRYNNGKIPPAFINIWKHFNCQQGSTKVEKS